MPRKKKKKKNRRKGGKGKEKQMYSMEMGEQDSSDQFKKPQHNTNKMTSAKAINWKARGREKDMGN